MKSIYRIFATLILAAGILCPAQAYAQKGEMAFGVQTGYTSTNNSAIAGMFFQYGITDHLRISPELGLVVRHENLDALTADVNLHFPLNLAEASDKIQLYPLAGLDFSSWTHHLVNTSDDLSKRVSRFGINLGGGFQYMAKPSLKLKIEAKYVLMEHYSTFVASVGIGYVF